MSDPSPPTPPTGDARAAGPPRTVADITALAAEAGIQRIHMLAWRDLADVEAGGSEVVAAKVAALWAEAGLDVTMRTSYAQGHPPETVRDGYRVVRRGGRYWVFPSAIIGEVRNSFGPRDAVFEVWNGVPFFTPVWAHCPRAVALHHVHHNMWSLVLEENLARYGVMLETKLAPPFYRRTNIVTLSESSRTEIIELLGMKPSRVTIASPGIEPQFVPGGAKSPHPLFVAVGRLMPPKKFDDLVRICHEVRADHPDLELVICGDGYEYDNLKGLIGSLGAHDWCRLAGRVTDADLVDLYQRSWAVCSASVAEGWGMTITEAAACGTPALATRIAGFQDSVVEGVSGLLGGDFAEMVANFRRFLADPDLRRRLSDGARHHAAQFTWEACAYGELAPIADDAFRRRRRSALRRR